MPLKGYNAQDTRALRSIVRRAKASEDVDVTTEAVASISQNLQTISELTSTIWAQAKALRDFIELTLRENPRHPRAGLLKQALKAANQILDEHKIGGPDDQYVRAVASALRDFYGQEIKYSPW